MKIFFCSASGMVGKMFKPRLSSNISFSSQLQNDEFKKDKSCIDNPLGYIKDKFDFPNSMAKYLSSVCDAISKDDDNSRSILTLIDCASKNNVESDIIMDLLVNPKLNPNIEKALKENTDEVHFFESKTEALAEAEPGEVFAVKNNPYALIKSSDDDILQLKITPSTYRKLFPQFQNMLVTQNFSSDCYILGVLNALMNFPSGKAKILSMFSESNNDVSVNFENGILSHKFENGNLPKNADMLRLAKGPLGIQMIELAYSDELLEQSIRNGDYYNLDSINSRLPYYYPKYTNIGDYLRDKQGYVDRFMNTIGLGKLEKCDLYKSELQDKFSDIVLSLDGFDNLIFIAASDTKPVSLSNGVTLKANHAYVIEPYIKNRAIKFRLYNSSNSAFYTDVYLADILNSFSRVYVGEAKIDS